MFTEILIVAALILLNGALAMSEMAIVSARPARLKPLEAKSRGAAADAPEAMFFVQPDTSWPRPSG